MKGFFGLPQNDKSVGIVAEKKVYVFKFVIPEFYGFKFWF
jgi:hypothetical protein